MDNKQLGQRIADLRKENNLSQKDLADKLCVSNKTISKWECGNGSPDIEILNKMSEIFKVSLDELVNNKYNMNEKNIQNNQVVSRKNFNKKALIFALIPISIVLLIITSIMCYFFIPRNPQIENSNIFKVDNEASTLYCTVSNETDFISLIDSLDLPLTNKWELYSDINTTDRINSKAVNLNVGDNIYYVLVKNNGGKQKIYELKIRRKPMYLISFNSNGGTQIESILVEEGNLIDINNIATPYLEGYTFAKWDYHFDNKIYEDTTLNAVWNANTYKILYKSNTDLEDIEQIVHFNNSVELYSNIFNRDHYNLYKWNTKPDGTGINYSISQNISKYNNPDDLILYAIWKPVTYQITYHLNEGINNNQNIKSYNIETEDFTLLEPTKSGYDFVGWFTDSNYKNSIEIIEEGSFGNLNLYACWLPHQYVITYHLNDGLNNNLNPSTYNVEDKQIELQNPTKDNSVFGGWFMDREYLTKKINCLDTSIKEDISLYAKWIDSTFTPISNFDELQNIQNNLSGNYYLVNDIVLLETEIWRTIEGEFTGVLDGQGYGITNLTSTLIGTNSGIVRNLSLENINISAWDEGNYSGYGSLINVNKGGQVINCSANGKITAYEYRIGGLIGYNYYSNQYNNDGDNISQILNCVSNVDIKINTSYGSGRFGLYVGGLCSEGTNIYNSYSTGDIEIVATYTSAFDYDTKSYIQVGGLLSSIQSMGIVKNCYAVGQINCTSNFGKVYVAGLCARGDIDYFSNCFSDCEINIVGKDNFDRTDPTFIYSLLLNQDHVLLSKFENGYYIYGDNNFMLGNKTLTLKEADSAKVEYYSDSKTISYEDIPEFMSFTNKYFNFYLNDYPDLKVFN